MYIFLISGQFDDYVEVDDNEKGPQSEQKIWEKKKERQAQYSFVSEDKRRKQEEKSKKYDLILDDEIEFIQALKMPGKTPFLNIIYLSWITVCRVFFFALNFLPWDFLFIKKLEIEKTKTTQCTTFKTDMINMDGSEQSIF